MVNLRTESQRPQAWAIRHAGWCCATSLCGYNPTLHLSHRVHRLAQPGEGKRASMVGAWDEIAALGRYRDSLRPVYDGWDEG